jgi:hypothetical protein
MKRAIIAGAAIVAILVLLVFADRTRMVEQDGGARVTAMSASASAPASVENAQGFLYGRVDTDDGAAYEGRLRFGGSEEALWSNYFNGYKDQNPWAAHIPREAAETDRTFKIFGVQLSFTEGQTLRRPLMAQFGDIARIEADGRDLWVTMKSRTRFHVDRSAADDFADGLRVWDIRRGVVNLDEWRIRSIEFLPTPGLGAMPAPLHGTVRTQRGDFTGFVQWDRQACLDADELVGRTPGGEATVPFGLIRSIARRSNDSALVTLKDGREMVLSGTRAVGAGHRGIYIDDRRYGRVLVSWHVFERIDFSAGGSAPAYTDFPPGRPLAGSVSTRDGRRLTGRLVYDLDESETTETLDAPSDGVDYTIPFGLIAAIAPDGQTGGGTQRAAVTLHDGGVLQLERTGDLGDANGGVLIFVNGAERAEHVAWTDVAQIDFDRPAALHPAPVGR